MSHPFIIGANWKMHKGPGDTKDYLGQMIRQVPQVDQKHFVFFSPAVNWWVCRDLLAGTSFSWGAQNCYFEDQGAFTGENSPLVLQTMGAGYCLVGHSERRQLFGETREFIQKKVQTLYRHGIHPMLCVGETQAEKERGHSFKAVERQLSGMLQNKNSSALYVVYEPVWAIGSGQVPVSQDIYEMQNFIHQLVGKSTVVLYGGSVSLDNIRELSLIDGIQGVLVGGASLDPNAFCQLFQKIPRECLIK